ncbi:MAG: aminotransferase class IV [Bifidobacteriaceae bacterium]|jgi:branched-chain amino acid aminotransferase|nr:aminotransferase class IV [Bifidobacteriaceae bacterium]
MAFSRTDSFVWIDGRIVAAGEATGVSVFDHGFIVGDGVFEAIRLDHGRPLALGLHLDRWQRSAAGLGLVPLDREAAERCVAEVLDANRHVLDGSHDILRLTYTAGPGFLGSPREAGTVPTMVAAVTSGHVPEPATSVITVPWPRNERGALAGLKTTSYGENAMALAHARAAGASEAIFATTTGRLCEGTGSNIFIVRDGLALTPPLDDGVLAGITRILVMQQNAVTQQSVPLASLADADEAFLTSTVRDVQAVTQVDGKAIGDGQIGPVTRAAMERFAAAAPTHLT